MAQSPQLEVETVELSSVVPVERTTMRPVNAGHALERIRPSGNALGEWIVSGPLEWPRLRAISAVVPGVTSLSDRQELCSVVGSSGGPLLGKPSAVGCHEL